MNHETHEIHEYMKQKDEINYETDEGEPSEERKVQHEILEQSAIIPKLPSNGSYCK